ncbi:MAG TPA: hypothetical protein VKV26_11415 [Dehalococcoidia bacterium]|nr:hypothetical protein [Dehalococcoidia bacterium]
MEQSAPPWQPHPADAQAFRTLAAVLRQRAKTDPEARGQAQAAALASFARELGSSLCTPFRDAVNAVPIESTTPVYLTVGWFTNLARHFGLPYPRLWGELLTALRVHGPAFAAADAALLGGLTRTMREELGERVTLHLAAAGGAPWRYTVTTPDNDPGTIRLSLPGAELPRRRRQAELTAQIAPLFKRAWRPAKRAGRAVEAAAGYLTQTPVPAGDDATALLVVELEAATTARFTLDTARRLERARAMLVDWLLDLFAAPARRGGGRRPSWKAAAHWWALAAIAGLSSADIAGLDNAAQHPLGTAADDTDYELTDRIARTLSRLRALV